MSIIIHKRIYCLKELHFTAPCGINRFQIIGSLTDGTLIDIVVSDYSSIRFDEVEKYKKEGYFVTGMPKSATVIIRVN